MQQSLRRTWAEIHLDRLEENARCIRNTLTPGCRMLGTVKADAYGHGAVMSARALLRAGVSYFGVSNLEEAIQLRNAGIREPILVISYTPPLEAVRLAKYDVTQTVLSLEYARELDDAALAAGVRIRIHIKLDTGMSRVGFVCHTSQDMPAAVEAVSAACYLPSLIPEGIFTHFASADEEDDDGFTRHQFAMFTGVTDALEKQGVRFTLRHCCNSAATLRYPEMHLDMVRPGIILYGLAPDVWMRDMLPLKPVMELKTAVSMVKELPAGTPLSYNRTFSTERDTTVATVPIGYADGYCRALSNRAQMLIGGRRVPVIGRVCMDQCMLDVTGLADVQEGTVATIFGRDGAAVLPVEEMAAWMNTINYEVICLIGKRVPRLFYRGETLVGQLNYILPSGSGENG